MRVSHSDFAGFFFRPPLREEPDCSRPGRLPFGLCLEYHLLHVSDSFQRGEVSVVLNEWARN